MAIAIDLTIALKKSKLCASVELEKNASTRGQVAVDWLNTGYSSKSYAFEATGEKNVRRQFASEHICSFRIRTGWLNIS